ncbi:MAG: arginase family protein [Bacteroidota bacterium]
MSGLVPHGLTAPETSRDDPRLGQWLAKAGTVREDTEVVLVGFPSDAGVVRNGGRAGAAAGPRAIREALHTMTPGLQFTAAFGRLLARTVDLGDIAVSGDVETDQERLAAVVSEHSSERVVVVLGGGHETAYGHVLGSIRAGREVHVLNWDAHADVREVRAEGGHSGSPFRQALEHPSRLVRSYSVAGLHPWRVAQAHVEYVRERGGAVYPLGSVTAEAIPEIVGRVGGPAMASFDIDAVDASAAPGVSAPGVGGMAPGLWLQAAEACGRATHFGSFEVVEVNPRFDVDGRTATLAALTVWHVLRGIAAR